MARRVTELLGIEEEVLVGTINNYLVDQRVGAVSVKGHCQGREAGH